MRLTRAGIVLALAFCASLHAQSITRARVMENAGAYRDLAWTMSARNFRDACVAGTYICTPFSTGNSIVGMAYNWGGMNTIAEFRSGIGGSGYAGNRCTKTNGNCCLRANTFGVDCSGFVQKIWQHPGTAKLGTSGLATITNTIRLGNAGMRSGDIFLLRDDHTAVFSHVDASGNPWVIEASATDWKVSQRPRSWSYYSAWEKRRYRNLQDGGIGKIDQGLTLSSRPRVNQWFTATFRLKETDGASIRYDDVTVAILDQWGRFKFDLQHRGSTALAADGTISIAVGGTASLTAGTYIAVARGKVGSVWSDLLPTTGGRNSVWFTVER